MIRNCISAFLTRAFGRRGVPAAAAASLIGVGFSLAATPALADDAAAAYPTKPITFVVPFPPGGLTDRLARTLAEKLHLSMGQQVIVENRAGAGGTIGAEHVSRAKPDGYTILLGTHASHAINVSLMKLPYDAVKNFEPISLLGTVPNMLLLRPGMPANSVKELIAMAKAKPGSLSYTSAGIGSSGHMAGSMLASAAGIELLHVPAKGAPQANNDALAGHVDILFDSITLSMPLVKSGKLKALAVTSRERAPAMPDLPTMIEAGVPDYEIVLWFAVFAPAGTPQAIVQKLSQETAKAFSDRALRESFERDGTTIVAGTPQQLAQFQRAEIEKWGKVVRSLGLTAK